MKIVQFYEYLDQELNALVVKYANDSMIKKHHKNPDNQKSYAFLIWFLETYAGDFPYQEYITDGEDDHAIDLIFSRKDHLKQDVFYVVQSKWRNKKGAESNLDKDEVLRTLQEFQTILNGRLKTSNAKVNEKLEKLKTHQANNGLIRFIFLTLSQNLAESQISDNIKAFERQNPGVRFEIVDIRRLRLDYIDRLYKGIHPPSILQTRYDAYEETISLEVERLEEDKPGTFLELKAPFRAFIFLVRPAFLHQLFKRYHFLLFHKNVRNPLISSDFNTRIEETALKNPSYFWYYNNGITAVTRSLPSEINNQARNIKIQGLQIINGAQTVYALYQAYEKASEIERIVMQENILVSLRLIHSANDDFNLDITRYTNSQNPVSDRDFWSNDTVQLRLQEESFQTNVWYEKRSGEFRHRPQGIHIMQNDEIAPIYAAFWLEKPFWQYESAEMMEVQGINLFFSSNKKNPQGRYEDVFNDKTSYTKFLSAWCVQVIFDEIMASSGWRSIFFNPHYVDFHIFLYLPFVKIALKFHYMQTKGLKEYEVLSGMDNLIIKDFNQKNFSSLAKIMQHTILVVNKGTGNFEDLTLEDERTAMLYQSYFDHFSKERFDAQAIQNSTLEPKIAEAIQNLEQKFAQLEL